MLHPFLFCQMDKIMMLKTQSDNNYKALMKYLQSIHLVLEVIMMQT